MNFKVLATLIMLAMANLAMAGHNRPVRVVCVGASITEGGLTTNPATDSYPAQLAVLLGDGYDVVNLGVSSSTMLKNGDFSYWTKGKLDEALASNPDIVLIDLGGNDSKSINRPYLDEYEGDARDMVAMFKNLPSKPRVILMTPVVSFEKNSAGIWDSCIVNDVIPAVRSAAIKSGAELIDMHPVLDKFPQLFADGVHPNTLGSGMMAKHLYDYITSDAPGGNTMPLIVANPMTLNYRFQPGPDSVRREAADPVCEWFKDAYYLFASKSGGYWRSENLKDWSYIPCSTIETIEDYAPTVLAMADTLYYLGSDHQRVFKNATPQFDTWTEVDTKLTIPIHDPAFFLDDDGRVYLYSGCSDVDPIIGVEVDPSDGFREIGTPVELIYHNGDKYGWEVPGENNEENRQGWNEGPCVIKQDGRYYLQYAAPGTQYRIYGDGIYVGDSPLGPFEYMENNPMSFKPGGFIGGAGHGHTFRDKFGNLWHVASMTIAARHWFERRLGLFPVTLDADKGMYALTEWSDYPYVVPQTSVDFGEFSPYMGWNLLSRGKSVSASSSMKGHRPTAANDERVETWWAARTGKPGEWFKVDLGKIMSVNAVQVNFADHDFKVRPPHEPVVYRYHVEMSTDGKNWIDIADRRSNDSIDAPHELFILDVPADARYVRVVNDGALDGNFSLFDLRVFGNGGGAVPSEVTGFKAVREPGDPRAWSFSWNPSDGADGYVLRWGIDKDSLTHSAVVYGNRYDARYFNRDSNYAFSITPFNENGLGSTVLYND